MFKKRFSRIGILIILYFSLTLFFNACCGDEFSRLKGIQRLSSYQPMHPTNPYTDSISMAFKLGIWFEMEYLTSHNPRFITSAYAFQPCPREVVNPIDLSSLKITLDTDFLYGMDTVKAGSSLLDLPGNNVMSSNYVDYEYGIDIRFDTLFLSKAKLENDWHEFTITMTNFDTIPETFTESISLYWNIQ